MPEAPEVEVVRRGLAEGLTGRHFVSVSVGRERVVRRTSRPALIEGMTGARVMDVDRRGKYLTLALDTGRAVMIHLRMSGQVLLVNGADEAPAHTHVDALVDDGRRMLFVDPRTFGEVVVFDPGDVDRQIPELARLGPDPLRDGLDLREFRRRLRQRHRALKALLLDQSFIAGIGNIYADEICHRARLRPTRPSDALGLAGERRLAAAIVEVLGEAVLAGGSTLADAQYVGVDGRGGSYQTAHRVHARAGERCGTCGRGIVRRSTVAQRGTHHCPVCQR